METELSPQTAWQNEGICYRYAEDKLNDCVLRSIYMAIVRRSFGYGKLYTDRISQEDLAKASAITSRTLRDKLKILESMKMIKIIPPDTIYKRWRLNVLCLCTRLSKDMVKSNLKTKIINLVLKIEKRRFY